MVRVWRYDQFSGDIGHITEENEYNSIQGTDLEMMAIRINALPCYIRKALQLLCS